MQADDFFNAYLVLKENNEAFFESAGKTHEKAKAFGALPTMGPSVMNLAFSVELYIKDLHFALKGKAPRGHNIFKLFQALPEEVKQKIFAHDAISQNPFATRGNIFSPLRFTKAYRPYDGFIDQLKDISDGFEKWRYAHEKTTLKYEEWFALAFIEAVKSTADTIRIRSAA